jgi:hypothetical protein
MTPDGMHFSRAFLDLPDVKHLWSQATGVVEQYANVVLVGENAYIFRANVLLGGGGGGTILEGKKGERDGGVGRMNTHT